MNFKENIYIVVHIKLNQVSEVSMMNLFFSVSIKTSETQNYSFFFLIFVNAFYIYQLSCIICLDSFQISAHISKVHVTESVPYISI